MKLIEEIKKAEETAEKLKKEAYQKGQEQVETERDEARKALAAIGDEKETRFAHARQEAQVEAAKMIKVMDKEHDQELAQLDEKASKQKKKAIQRVQETIIAWPSSQ